MFSLYLYVTLISHKLCYATQSHVDEARLNKSRGLTNQRSVQIGASDAR